VLVLKLEKQELWDEQTSSFSYAEEATIELEHNLVSVYQWESKWKKPFLAKNEKTNAEVIDYIKCMTKNVVEDNVYDRLTSKHYEAINKYIDDIMTATTFHNQDNKNGNSSVMTAELLYYYMTAFNIDFQCQYWHLNRLLTLIDVCSIKSQPEKKMSKKDVYRQNKSLNAARKAKLGTKG